MMARMQDVSRSLLCAALLLALVVAPPAQAEQAAQTGASAPQAKRGNTLGFGTDKGGGKLLSRAELRECLARKPQLAAESDAMAREQAELDARKAELAGRQAELAADAELLRGQEARIDRASQAAVDEHNRRVGEIEQRVARLERDSEAYNTSLPDFNRRADAHAQAQTQWNATCAGRPYSDADLGAVQGERPPQ